MTLEQEIIHRELMNAGYTDAAEFVTGIFITKCLKSNHKIIDLTNLSYHDRFEANASSPERQLELLKSNLALAVKRMIKKYRVEPAGVTNIVVDDFIEELEYLTGVSYIEDNE